MVCANRQEKGASKMAKLWKIRAWFGNIVGKIFTLIIIVALILGVLYLLRGAMPFVNNIYGMMGLQK